MNFTEKTVSDLQVVLYQPEIPDNTGAVGRTCVAAGVRLFLVKPLGFRLDHRRIARAGMDYWKYLDYQTANDWQDLCSKLPGRRWYFSKKGVKCFTEARFLPGDSLVFGSESSGLPQSILDEDAEHCISIPMRSVARSLNLSVSVGIAVYEAKRQLELLSKKDF